MSASSSMGRVLGLAAGLALVAVVGTADEPAGLPRAFIDGTGPGWRALGEDDFARVNCDPDTWTWKDGVVHCTGTPVGVTRTKQPVTNFELVAQWRHLKSGGNSGIFVWAPEKALKGLKPNTLPARRHRGAGARPRLRRAVREADRARSPTGSPPTATSSPSASSKMKPFPPVSPDGSRSFPSKHLSQGRRRVEPLLRARHQRRGPPLGQRRGGLRRKRLRARVGLPLPRIRGLAGRVQEPADPGTAVRPGVSAVDLRFHRDREGGLVEPPVEVPARRSLRPPNEPGPPSPRPGFLFGIQ